MIFKQKDINVNNLDLELISSKYNIPKKIAKILLSRCDKNEIDDFIFPDINKLFNPYLFSNMEKVINRIKQANMNKERVLIFGDYDVDGITATSILGIFFNDIGLEFNYFIPDRKQGYGLTKISLDEAIGKYQPNLIITVDCGITSVEEVEYLKQKNIEVIITDHHQPQENLPNTLILNPHLEDLKFKELCGAGVAFKIVQAYYQNKQYYAKYIPIAAIGTIADLVPLYNDNRIIVKSGLMLSSLLPKGVKILIDKLDLNIEKLNSYHIGFKLAPTLNAIGRLKNAQKAVKLFLSDDETELLSLVEELIEINKIRQDITETIFDDAIKKLKILKLDNIIILKDETWDSGVIGIVASRLVETFNIPCILFNENKQEKLCKGSCRSVENIDIFQVLIANNHLIEQFGGHKMAAGLTIKSENFDEFVKSVSEYIKLNCGEKTEKIVYFDNELNYDEIDNYFVDKLKILEPFGEGNQLPIFKIEITNPNVSYMKNGYKHLIVNFKDIKARYFNAGDLFDSFNIYNKSDNLVKLSFSNFNGRDYLTVIIDKTKFANLSNDINEEIIAKNYFQALFSNININENIEQISSVNQMKDNVLVVTYNYENYKKFLNQNNDKFSCFFGDVSLDEIDKNLILGLKNTDIFPYYKNIYFLEENFAKYIKIPSNVKVLSDFNTANKSFNIKINKLLVGKVFLALKNVGNNEEISTYFRKNSLIELYEKISELFKDFNLSYCQFLLSLCILEELGILKFDNQKFFIDIKIKNSIENSNLYNEYKE